MLLVLGAGERLWWSTTFVWSDSCLNMSRATTREGFSRRRALRDRVCRTVEFTYLFNHRRRCASSNNGLKMEVLERSRCCANTR